MLKVNSVANLKTYQPYVNFKANNAENTQYTSYDSSLIQDDISKIQKEQKKQKLKNNIMLTLSALASIAIIGMCGMAMFGKGGGLGSYRSATEKEAVKLKAVDLKTIIERPKDSYSEEVQEFLKKLKGLLTRSDIEDKGGKRICQVELSGPGGTGKTDVAGVIAKKVNELYPGSEYYIPDLSMLSSSFLSGQNEQLLTEYTNNLAARADKLAADFKKDGKKRYVICFLDEYDKIAMEDFGLSRSNSNKTNGVLKTLINSLKAKDNVILLSATNHPEEIEGAVSSRMSQKVLVDFLSPKQTMTAIMEHYKKDAKERLISEDLLKQNDKLQQICDIISKKEHCMEYRKLFEEIMPTTLDNSPDGGTIELKHLVEAVTSQSIARNLRLTPEEISSLKQIVNI